MFDALEKCSKKNSINFTKIIGKGFQTKTYSSSATTFNRVQAVSVLYWPRSTVYQYGFYETVATWSKTQF